ncbi:MAG: hypothetical protein QF699_04450 [Candidatus Poseidoniaceae archaeon]|nr:hypothetical protein [Candidatus Poseidoniaceae archaeon]
MAEQETPGFVIPQCDSCSRPAVLEQAYSGRILCNEHMAKSVRKKIAKELRQQLVLPKDRDTTIFVAISELFGSPRGSLLRGDGCRRNLFFFLNFFFEFLVFAIFSDVTSVSIHAEKEKK